MPDTDFIKMAPARFPSPPAFLLADWEETSKKRHINSQPV